MSRPAPRRLATPVGELAAELAPTTPLARAQEAWERALGADIAAAARPVAEREGILTAVCESAVWAQELELMGPELLARLNAEMDGQPLVRLRCRSG